jgi:hypothetical protein
MHNRYQTLSITIVFVIFVIFLFDVLAVGPETTVYPIR